MQTAHATLFNAIPITQKMGLRLVRYDHEGLVISAPLAENVNDKQTAFAGSLATVVTLSGWALITLLLQDAGIDANVVIARSEIDYKKPVTQDFQATCLKPDDTVIARFLGTLKKHGKARIALRATIATESGVAVELSGAYAALLKP